MDNITFVPKPGRKEEHAVGEPPPWTLEVVDWSELGFGGAAAIRDGAESKLFAVGWSLLHDGE